MISDNMVYCVEALVKAELLLKEAGLGVSVALDRLEKCWKGRTLPIRFVKSGNVYTVTRVGDDSSKIRVIVDPLEDIGP